MTGKATSAVVTRQQAIAGGLTRYFTGKPCKRGHVTERNRFGQCLECAAIRSEAWRVANPEKPAQYQCDYEIKNGASIKQSRRAKYLADPQEVKRRTKAWRAANPAKVKAQGRRAVARRRERIGSADGHYTDADLQRIYRQQRGYCAMPECRAPLRDDYEVDHIKPLARHGTNWPRNLQLLCMPCNRAKGSRDPIDHARLAGRLV